MKILYSQILIYLNILRIHVDHFQAIKKNIKEIVLNPWALGGGGYPYLSGSTTKIKFLSVCLTIFCKYLSKQMKQGRSTSSGSVNGKNVDTLQTTYLRFSYLHYVIIWESCSEYLYVTSINFILPPLSPPRTRWRKHDIEMVCLYFYKSLI